MTTPEFIAWLDAKMAEHGVGPAAVGTSLGAKVGA
jgi:hypothetical protein